MTERPTMPPYRDRPAWLVICTNGWRLRVHGMDKEQVRWEIKHLVYGSTPGIEKIIPWPEYGEPCS